MLFLHQPTQLLFKWWSWRRGPTELQELFFRIIWQETSDGSRIRNALRVGSEGVLNKRRDFILLFGRHLIYALEGALQARCDHTVIPLLLAMFCFLLP
jgi:hypothetical protein